MNMTLINIWQILVSIAIIYNGENSYQLFSIGCQLEFAGKIPEAIEYYKMAKVLDPNSPEIYLSLAHASYKIRKLDDGINFATEGISIFPNNSQLYLIIGTGYIGKGNLKQAIKFYEKALAIEPKDTEIYASISLLYEGMGDIKKAIVILDSMPEDLKTREMYQRLGSLAGKLNNHKNAIEYYQKSYTMDTTNTTALIGIGAGFDIMGVRDSAIYYYEKMLSQDTFNLNVARRLVEFYSENDQYEKMMTMTRKILDIDYYDGYARRNLGFALYKSGMLQEALNEFLIASGTDPRDTYSKFYVGRIFLEQGNYNAAQREILDAINIDPDFVELWIYLGFIAIDKKDYKTAEYAFDEAAHHGGDLTQIYYLLGITAETQNNNTNAYFYYHKALGASPKDVASLGALANLCARIGKKDEAFTIFQQVLALDTTNAVALNYVGYTYTEQNDSLEYALSLIDKALSIEENNGYYIDSRGWVFYQMGRYEEAMAELKKASELVEDAVVLEHLGDVYLKLNDIERAKQAYEKALILDAKNKAVKEKLLKIKGD